MTTVTELIAASSDDGHIFSEDWYGMVSEGFVNNSNNARVGYDIDEFGTPELIWYTWLRFTSVAIAQGTTIDNAKVSLRSSGGTDYVGKSVYIFAEDVDDSSAPSSYSDIYSATKTSAFAGWTLSAQSDDGTFYDSPDIKTVIQEIVDRSGWSSGNDITILLWNGSIGSEAADNWNWNPYMIDKGSGYEPKLIINYTAADVTVTPSAITADASTPTTFILGISSFTATADAGSVNPTVTLGSLSVTPSTATSDSVTVNPTVTLGSLSVTPSAATAEAGSSSGSVTLDSFSVTPSAGTAEAQTSSNFGFKLTGFTATSDASTSLGSVIESLTPSPATADAGTVNPTVILGSISITPSAATADTSSSAGTITLGSISITPAVATSDAVSVAPTITLSSISVTPAIATSDTGTVNPTIALGSFSVTPSSATADTGVDQGTITLSSFSHTPTSASSKASTVTPMIILGSFTIITPVAATASTGASTGTFGYSSITVTPTIITSDADTVAPSVILGSLSVTPAVSTGDAATTNPTVTIGPPLVVSPDPATADTGVYIPLIVPAKATASARTIISGVLSDKITSSKVPSLLKPAATTESFSSPKGENLVLTKPALTTETLSTEN